MLIQKKEANFSNPVSRMKISHGREGWMPTLKVTGGDGWQRVRLKWRWREMESGAYPQALAVWRWYPAGGNVWTSASGRPGMTVHTWRRPRERYSRAGWQGQRHAHTQKVEQKQVQLTGSDFSVFAHLRHHVLGGSRNVWQKIFMRRWEWCMSKYQEVGGLITSLWR